MHSGGMSRSLRRTIAVPSALPLPALLVAALVGTSALAACNDGGSTAAGSPTSSGSSSSTMSSTASPSPSPSSSTSSTTPSPTPSANVGLSKACLNSTARVASATIRWNAALLTKRTSVIRPAADNYRTTAAAIRTTTRTAADKTYTVHVHAVAQDMETLAAQSSAGRTASGVALSRDSKTLAGYCQGKVVS